MSKKVFIPIISVLVALVFLLSPLAPAAIQNIAIPNAGQSVGEILHPSGNPWAHTFSDTKDIRTATFVVAAADSVHEYDVDYRCDGAADQVEIQAAIDALANGGTVVLLEGNFSTSATIEIGTGIRLIGQGHKTIITLANDSDCVMIQNKDVTNGNQDFSIENLQLDANGVNQSDNVDEGDKPRDLRQAIRIRGTSTSSKRFSLLNCYIHDVRHGTAVSWRGDDWLIQGNIFYNNGVAASAHKCDHVYTNGNRGRIIGNSLNTCTDTGIASEQGEGITITGNTVKTAAMIGIGVGNGATDVAISGNTIINITAATGRGIFVQPAGGDPVKRIAITGNTIRGVLDRGISVDSVSEVTISGNLLEDCDKYGIIFIDSTHGTIAGNWIEGTASGTAIIVEDSDYISVTGNTMRTTETLTASCRGILAMGATNVVISSNVIKGVSGQGSTWWGIAVYHVDTVAARRCSVIGNVIETADIGIYIVRQTYDIIANNRIDGAVTGIESGGDGTDWLLVHGNIIQNYTDAIVLVGANNTEADNIT